MNDVREMMNRQAAWQKSRARLSWPEKIKQAEILRDAFMKLRSAHSVKPIGDNRTGCKYPSP